MLCSWPTRTTPACPATPRCGMAGIGKPKRRCRPEAASALLDVFGTLDLARPPASRQAPPAAVEVKFSSQNSGQAYYWKNSRRKSATFAILLHEFHELSTCLAAITRHLRLRLCFRQPEAAVILVRATGGPLKPAGDSLLTTTPSPANSFRNVMRKLASSVVVITARAGSEKNGLTATAMCSLSTDPQSIVACINKDASATELVLQSGSFAINLLAEDQQEIAKLFSTPKLPADERFSSGRWHELKSGAPILRDALANLDCELATHFLYGTHYILVGRVLAIESREGRGLLYCDGQYRKLAMSA